MRHFFCVLSFLLGLCGGPINICAEHSSPDGPVCVTVGNVSVSIGPNGNSERSYLVFFQNYNAYATTVTWEVYGTDEKGNTRKIAGGTKVVPANSKNSDSFLRPSNVDGLWVKSSTQKCN